MNQPAEAVQALTFDPASFLMQETSDQMDTQFVLIPAGEYPAMIKTVAARQQQNPADPAILWTILDVTYAIDDAGVREETGLPEPTIRQSIFLDLGADNKLDAGKGKNVNLGRLREAVGLNQPGQAFSFGALVGQACVVAVKHTPDKKDPEITYANVNKVASLT
ncbi:MAG: hypothetical protein O7D34_05230 [Ignavibacteria bacterium]|nr:hypothetical protein [Ignavibacteria bacterium]